MSTVAYGPLPEHRADVHLPDEPDAPVLVYFHGGGLESGTRADNPKLFTELVAAGIGVVSGSYRRYPQARYPEFLEDAAACVAWAIENLPGRRIVVSGTSAGAYLAMMLRFDQRWLGAHGVGRDAVHGWLFDAGQPTTHFSILRERGIDPNRVIVDEAAPLFHISSETSPAPTLLVLAGDDVPGGREQTDLMLATLKACGADDDVRAVTLDGYQHVAYLGDDAGRARLIELVAELVRDLDVGGAK
ncbi:alpha/beta hydrolase [Pseudactinotalea terrae]|uniref:alpha/beta hydrolase n=1 Tax=Pseudactinotalea terrae TaxID=1743262 RepID=UPI0013918124|nr:alpha/beta hydrolase [Pseudactinotalea terrae]